MPAGALYLKYRPQTFAEVEGQAHITQTLKNAIALGRVAHAYLLTGPRGTGKTTTARLLAKAINCVSQDAVKPCNVCAVCRAINEDRLLDLIEIDAATHTGADHMRDLREKADFRPTDASFKVYIIDEVHMLSTAAFNALLKILEEPPPHVVFILATTDPQKIPATVLSRVQRFDFRRLTLPEITARLNEISQKEGLKVEAAAIELIARQATGAMRDAISLLDQMRAYGNEITLAQVRDLLGAGSHEMVRDFVASLSASNVAGGLTIIGQAIDGGADPRQLAREIVEYLRGLLLIQAGSGGALSLTSDDFAEMEEVATKFTPDSLIHAIRLFNQAAFELKSSASPTLPLEIAFVEATLNQGSVARPAWPTATTEVKGKGVVTESSAPAPVVRKPSTEKKPRPDESEVLAAAPAGPVSIEAVRSNWNRILAQVRPKDKMIEALLRNAELIKVDGDQLILGFPHAFHAERFEKQPNGKAIVESAMDQVFHQKVRVKCIQSPKMARLKAVEEDPLIRAAVNQLGAQITEIHDQEVSK